MIGDAHMRYRYRFEPASQSTSQPESWLSTVEELDAFLDRLMTEYRPHGTKRVIDVFNWCEDGKFLGIRFGTPTAGHP